MVTNSNCQTFFVRPQEKSQCIYLSYAINEIAGRFHLKRIISREFLIPTSLTVCNQFRRSALFSFLKHFTIFHRNNVTSPFIL